MSHSENTIVLVAESLELRRMVLMALEQGGFAADGCEPEMAPTLLRQAGFRVLITNALEHALNPLVPTIYLALEAPLEPVPDGVRVLLKPFSIEALLNDVRQLLAQAPANRRPVGSDRPHPTHFVSGNRPA